MTINLMENERLDDLQRNGLKIIQKKMASALEWMQSSFPVLHR